MNINFKMFFKVIIKIIFKPLIFLSIGYLLNLSWYFIQLYYPIKENVKLTISFYFLNCIEFIAIYWIILNAIKYGKQELKEWLFKKNRISLFTIISPIMSSLEGIVLLVMINMLIPLLNLQGALGLFSEKIAQIMLIIIIGWIFYEIISSFEKYITDKYIDQNTNIIASRKINTQLTILKRVLLALVFIIIISSILMVFDNIKAIGASLLTTAGILGAIGAFASQQTLSRIFAGLQIAFTQPIRIGDTVIIDNEFGEVEEITLSFITIKLWDLRRLILPTDYFTNKGLLNLTHHSSELLGTIFLYADYTLPIEEIRKKFIELLTQSPLWNKKVGELEVTDIKEKTIEVRCLMSADNSSNLWKLRCSLREKLIKFIVENYPNSLTMNRHINYYENKNNH